jgi:hypothetical protein
MPLALPVVLCGQSPQIAMGVIKGLQPEYDGLLSFPMLQIHPNSNPVIHVILDPAQGASAIPALLQGKAPPAGEGNENIGSRNYYKPPVAVVTGGGYDDAAFKKMYDAAKGKGKKVPWLRPDMTIETPPMGPDYGKHILGRAKACLGKLDSEGKLGDQGKEEGAGIVFY